MGVKASGYLDWLKGTALKKSLGLVVLGLLVVAAFLAAQNTVLDFKLVNKTGVDIHKVNISAANDDEWGEDIMEEDILADGDSVDIEFDPEESHPKWDLRVTDDEGTSIVWKGLDLAKINILTLKIVNGKPIAEIK